MTFYHPNTSELADALSETAGWIKEEDTTISLDYLKLFTEAQQRRMIWLMNKYCKSDTNKVAVGKDLIQMLDSRRKDKKIYINNKLMNNETNYPMAGRERDLDYLEGDVRSINPEADE